MLQQTDEQLMLCVKQGQAYVLGELFERHHVKLYNFFLKFCGNSNWSEDMVQNTFLKMLKYAYSYHVSGKFQAWMFNIARNVAVDYLRREINGSANTYHDLDSIEGHIHDPEYIQELEQEERKIQQAILRLPVEKRQLLLLSKLNQISMADLAQMYGCNTSTIKVRIHRALEELRKYCKENPEVVRARA